MPPKANLHRTVVGLTRAQYEWLRRRGYERHVSLGALIREILEEARRKEEPQEPLPLES